MPRLQVNHPRWIAPLAGQSSPGAPGRLLLVTGDGRPGLGEGDDELEGVKIRLFAGYALRGVAGESAPDRSSIADSARTRAKCRAPQPGAMLSQV